jgi:hypothetical protein
MAGLFVISEQRSVQIIPELGYTYGALGPEHLASAGAIVTFGNLMANVGGALRLVVGSAASPAPSAPHFAVGGRATVYGSFIGELLFVEAGGQTLDVEGSAARELRATAGINLSSAVLFVLSYVMLKDLHLVP